MDSLTPLAPKAPGTKHFRRVALPCTLYFTVQTPADPNKGELREAVFNALNVSCDAEVAIPIKGSSGSTIEQCEFKVHIDHLAERTIDGAPIFTFKNLRVIDSFESTPENV